MMKQGTGSNEAVDWTIHVLERVGAALRGTEQLFQPFNARC